MRLKEGNIFKRRGLLQQDGLEPGQAGSALECGAELYGVELQPTGNSGDTVRREDAGRLAHQQHAESRKVVGQDTALTIQNASARGDHRKIADAVALGQIRILPVLAYLQPPVSHQQAEESCGNDILKESNLPRGRAFVTGKSDFHPYPYRRGRFSARGPQLIQVDKREATVQLLGAGVSSLHDRTTLRFR